MCVRVLVLLFFTHDVDLFQLCFFFKETIFNNIFVCIDLKQILDLKNRYIIYI